MRSANKPLSKKKQLLSKTSKISWEIHQELAMDLPLQGKRV